MTAVGLVTFDCDGVLVDSMGIDMRELTRAIVAAGGTMTAQEVEDAFHGVALAEIERGVAAHLGRPVPDGWMERFLADRAAAFERELQPIDGAVEALDGVRAARVGRVHRVGRRAAEDGADAARRRPARRGLRRPHLLRQCGRSATAAAMPRSRSGWPRSAPSR